VDKEYELIICVRTECRTAPLTIYHAKYGLWWQNISCLTSLSGHAPISTSFLVWFTAEHCLSSFTLLTGPSSCVDSAKDGQMAWSAVRRKGKYGGSDRSRMIWLTAKRANGLQVARILLASSTCSESLLCLRPTLMSKTSKKDAQH
jgi:hypothetical protein